MHMTVSTYTVRLSHFKILKMADDAELNSDNTLCKENYNKVVF
jgi:hypothetical protein